MADVPLEEFDSLDFLGGAFVTMEEGFKNADYKPALEPFLDKLQETHSKHFEGQHSPVGAAWPPLKPSTIAKKGHSTILVDTTRLKQSLITTTGDSIRDVNNRTLVFGTEVPYSMFHQDGTKKLPQREHVGMNEKTTQEAVDAVADATVESLKYKVRK